jgi:antimicrobial peptide system SdpA family protein
MIFLKKVILFFWIIICGLIFLSSLKSELVMNRDVKFFISTIFPEGWGFFTKNPRDELLEVYKIENGKLIFFNFSNHTKKNCFGLSRSSRVIGYEASIILSSISRDDWKKSQTRVIKNHISDSIIQVKTDKNFHYITRGEYLFKIFKPVPYAWAKLNQKSNNPFSVVKIKVI